MKKRNKILLGLILIISFAKAEVNSFMPYFATLDYDSKSAKNSGTVNGFLFSTGTLSYLTQIGYSHTHMKYKNTTDDLTQDEITFIYNKYKLTYATKIGIHTNNTTDTDLMNGNTIILGISKWKYFKNYSKLTYGIDYYNSLYVNGHNLLKADANNTMSIRAHQFTPYFSYYKPFKTFSNILNVKYNYEDIKAYNKTYSSYQIKNTIYKGRYGFGITYMGGKMQTGVKKGGMVVYNSKDIITRSIGIDATLFVNKKLNTNLSYTSTTADEHQVDYSYKKDVKSNAVVIKVTYKF